MKRFLLALTLLVTLSPAVLAGDIQQPPANDKPPCDPTVEVCTQSSNLGYFDSLLETLSAYLGS